MTAIQISEDGPPADNCITQNSVRANTIKQKLNIKVSVVQACNLSTQ